MDKNYFNEIISKDIWSDIEKQLMEPYKVQRAVVMAAGLGTRLRPLTNEIPKPLITINGIRIIDTILDALLANGINEIYVITGYMSDKFDVLLEKYPHLHMINNLCFNEGNNILSACVAGNLIAGAYVMPADIYINNKDIFPLYQYSSNVLGCKTEYTDDWCIQTDSEGVIKRLGPKGENGYKDTGIFYWSVKDGTRLSKDIRTVCQSQEGRLRYWSNVPFEIYKDRYISVVRECCLNDVIEIDTLSDLVAIDPTYRE